jgi:hypothetical protein
MRGKSGGSIVKDESATVSESLERDEIEMEEGAIESPKADAGPSVDLSTQLDLLSERNSIAQIVSAIESEVEYHAPSSER